MRIGTALWVAGLLVAAGGVARADNPPSDPYPNPGAHAAPAQSDVGAPAYPQPLNAPAATSPDAPPAYPVFGAPAKPAAPIAAATATPAAAASPAPHRGQLALSITNPEAIDATWRCVDAVLIGRPDLARTRCGEALAKDEQSLLAHATLAECAPPELAASERDRAMELAPRASLPERLYIGAESRARDYHVADAKATYAQLIQQAPNEPRVYLWRARFERHGGELEAAVADAKQATLLDESWPVAHAVYGHLLLLTNQLGAAQAEAKRWEELSKGDPGPALLMARVALKRGDFVEAAAAAKRALTHDEKLLTPHLVLGDANLLAGKSREARKEYDVVLAAEDSSLHHEGAMHEARSWLYDGRPLDAEKAFSAEAELAGKLKRLGDQADALIERARVELDRSGAAEAGQSLRQVLGVFGAAQSIPGAIDEYERRRMGGDVLQMRAMVLAIVGERQLADGRADEYGSGLRVAGDVQADLKVRVLKGWIAARNGDDRTALVALAPSTRPTQRLALALAAIRAGDAARGHAIMEELSRRYETDLEGALTRPRALTWLKSQK